MSSNNNSPKISAVIPCLNEAATIAVCIEKAASGFTTLRMPGEIVVSDNGSTDGSTAIATALGAKVVNQETKGYGAALRKGIETASGAIIIMADADDSYDWSNIEPFVKKIEEGYDLVIGNRFQGGIEPGAMPFLHRYLGNPVLSLLARIAFGVKIGDFHCGMRAFRKDAVEKMQLRSDGMEFATEMIANAAHQGLRIGEIPTKLYKDKRGRPPHLRSFRDGWRHLRFILTYAPDYLYFVPGLIALLIGLGLLALLANGPVSVGGFPLGIHFLALGSLLTLTGFNVLSIGVFAKTLMSMQYPGLKSRTVQFIRHKFRLEYSLVAGTVLAVVGLGIDAVIFFEWLSRDRSNMNDTVHLAFAASTMAALGISILFGSFLLNLVSNQDHRKN